MAPIQTKLIDLSFLTPDEVQWLNEYHHTVYTTLSPYLKETEALEYLQRETAPISL